jgi:exodeoxyribonuclease VII small subunit
MSFDQDLEQLESIVQRLDRENLSLEEALGEFERGAELSRRCRAFLARTERHIAQIDEALLEDPQELEGVEA